MIKALIVDDEINARRILESLIAEHFPALHILSSAPNVPEALKLIHQHQPDLVFLDIEMPGYTGFQLLELVGQQNFQVIFTTAYAEYALQAFEVSAVDYVLKPIRIEKLKSAVEKALRQIQHPQELKPVIETLQRNLNGSALERLAVPVSDGLQFIEVSDIMLLEAEGAYTRLHTANAAPLLISKMIKDFESALENHPDFFRCHRSYLVNMRHVTKYSRTDGGSITLRNNMEVLIARDRKDALLQIIDQFRL